MVLSNPSQFLAADLQVRFRPQRQWVQGRGLFLIVAHFLSGIGAGAWLLAALGTGTVGLLAGWVLVGLGGLAHLLFLGRWTRFWRMIARADSSWISRGLLGITLFLLTGLVYLLLKLADQGSSPVGQVFLWLSWFSAAWVIVYKGFVWSSAKGIPLWNTPLLPVLYLVYGVRGGLAVLLLVALTQPAGGEVSTAEVLKLWLGVSSALLVVVYLVGIRGTGLTAARSVDALLSGVAAPAFLWGAVLLGLVVPIVLGAFALATGLALATPVGVVLLVIVSLTSLVGDLALIYAIARAGLYRPLPA